MQLLGLKGREYYFDSQISAAYEDLMADQLEKGYSEKIQEGKEFLLQQAVDELRQTKGRTALDSPGLCLEWVLFPSALALLQQVSIIEDQAMLLIILEHTVKSASCKDCFAGWRTRCGVGSWGKGFTHERVEAI
jgi:hypothetical protein